LAIAKGIDAELSLMAISIAISEAGAKKPDPRLVEGDLPKKKNDLQLIIDLV
jgi:hypothetical protein